MPSEQVLEVTRATDGVYCARIVTEPLGCLSSTSKREMIEQLRDLESREDCRVVVLTGTGRSFSVGSDIKEFDVDPAWSTSAIETEHELFETIESSQRPYIAACNGLTLGGGADLALACDWIIAAKSASFGFPEVAVGAFGATQRLPLAIGKAEAMRLLLSADIVSASEAADLRLVQQVVDDEQLMQHALGIAERIASFPPGAIAATKRCVMELFQNGRESGYRLEVRLNAVVGSSYDAVEGQRAFVEKREPNFSYERVALDAAGESETPMKDPG